MLYLPSLDVLVGRCRRLNPPSLKNRQNDQAMTCFIGPPAFLRVPGRRDMLHAAAKVYLVTAVPALLES